VNLITRFQQDGARAELTEAQNQMENIKEKIKTKDTHIMELQGKIEKHQSEASEARKVEQVNHFHINSSHFFSLGL
jgi:multidrug resistance efflux pump